MNKTLTLKNQKVPYTVRRSRRAKRVGLSVHANGSVVVTLPVRARESAAEAFVREKWNWLLKHLAFYRQFTDTSLAGLGRRDYKKHKEAARALVHARLLHFNSAYVFAYHSISIRNQKTCWGSCTAKGNLSFNYKILFLPEPLRDYVIVHELCHLRELNHSKKFWALVEHSIPNHAHMRKELKKIL
ncbi:MAG: SprT family zinc-dependent metalloprotease [bacterium]|nr:SprT family zinc-dependent metalloprotease [bacterium]